MVYLILLFANVCHVLVIWRYIWVRPLC